MTLTQLEYLLAVDAFRSFVRAAESCNIAQPSLSAQIMKIEVELGSKIFERSRSGVETTDVGRAIIIQARIALNEVQKIQNICLEHQNAVRGTLRLGIIPTVSPYLLPHFLEPLMREYPELKLELEEEKTEVLFSKLARGLLDAAVLSTPRNAPGNLVEKVLYYEPFVLFAGKGHALLNKSEILLSDLKPYNPTLLDDTHCMRDQVESVCGRAPSENAITLKVGALQTLMQLVEQQCGYTLLPALAQKSLSPAQQREKLRPFAEPVPTRRISLVSQNTPARRVLLRALEQSIRSNLPQEVFPTKERGRMNVLEPEARHFRTHS